MKKKYLLKILILSVFGIFLIVPTYGCKSKDKEIVITDNVKADLKSIGTEILKLIEEGNALLESGKFSEARASYEKAITRDKGNENIYLEIKDTYMKVKRFDDAYYFIKLAIDNNVSKDKMSKVLEEIKLNFSTVQLEDTILQGSDYSLPSPETIPVDTITNPVAIQWEQKNVDTSNLGVFTFNGYIDEYGRKVQLKLTINKVAKQTNNNGEKTPSESDEEFNKGEKNSNESEKPSNKVTTLEPKIENSDWNGDYYLKNGEGSLVTVQQDPSSIKFSISGRYSENEFIDSFEGVAKIGNDIAKYEQADGSVIIFEKHNQSFLITKFDNNHIVNFQGAYLKN